MTKFIQPYRVGDVVLIEGSEHIIQEVQVEGVGDYKYGTHRSAWHDHQDMTLVRECDEQSMELLLKSINDEDDENEEEVPDDDSDGEDYENEEEDEG